MVETTEREPEYLWIMKHELNKIEFSISDWTWYISWFDKDWNKIYFEQEWWYWTKSLYNNWTMIWEINCDGTTDFEERFDRERKKEFKHLINNKTTKMNKLKEIKFNNYFTAKKQKEIWELSQVLDEEIDFHREKLDKFNHANNHLCSAIEEMDVKEIKKAMKQAKEVLK